MEEVEDVTKAETRVNVWLFAMLPLGINLDGNVTSAQEGTSFFKGAKRVCVNEPLLALTCS